MTNNRNLSPSFWIGFCMIIIGACQSGVDKPSTTKANKFSDSTMVEIYDLQDKRNTEALLTFFDNKNPAYREAAALAMGSVQDTIALSRLAILLDDENAKVRKATAYALGQTYDSSAVPYLAQALSAEDSIFVKRELLEALGKVVTQSQIRLLYNWKTDTVEEKEGLAWGIYRAGLRNVYDGITTDLAVEFLDSTNSFDTRLGAAHYLAGTRGLDLSKYSQQLLTAAIQDKAANVRMVATLALRSIPTEGVRKVLMTTILKDSDYRVRVNGLHSLSGFKYANIKTAAFKSLKDQNVNVAITAANLIEQKADTSQALYITEEALRTKNPRIKAKLLGASLKLSDDKEKIYSQIKRQYGDSDDPYFKAGLLSALGSYLQAYEFVITQTFNAQHAAVSTAGINTLITMRSRPDFPNELKSAFADIFQQAIESGDIAMVALTAPLLSDTTYHFTQEYDSIDFLYTGKSKLSLPKDNEALQVLNKTIAYFEGKDELPETKNDYNHPIDWEAVKAIPVDKKMVVRTDKGDIMIRLLVDEAPGSVANFVALARQGYFDGKNFHRVVPNFVIQGGCNRGDGYGGEDYSIRSELTNLRYEEGSVGMASAGKDTEGTQWFITHSPTPHLDGRYTIFAKVTDGMETVHQIEVGDRILSVTSVEDIQK